LAAFLEVRKMTPLFRWLWNYLIVWPVVFGWLGVHLYHGDRLPKKGPAVIVANHTSHLDTVILMSIFPFRCQKQLRPVAAIDYFGKNRWMKWLTVKILNTILIKRHDFRPSEGNPLDECFLALNHEDILLVFPEGGRGYSEKLSKLKPGIAHLLKKYPMVPVFPIYLKGPCRSLPKGTVLPLPITCSVWVGKEIRWNSNRKRFMHRLKIAMKKLAQEACLQESAKEPSNGKGLRNLCQIKRRTNHEYKNHYAT